MNINGMTIYEDNLNECNSEFSLNLTPCELQSLWLWHCVQCCALRNARGAIGARLAVLHILLLVITDYLFMAFCVIKEKILAKIKAQSSTETV